MAIVYPNKYESRWVFITCFLFLLSACQKDSDVEIVSEDASYLTYIHEELKTLHADSEFTSFTIDFSQTQASGDGHSQQGVILHETSSSSYLLNADNTWSAESPASRKSLGSFDHVKVNERVTLTFDQAYTPLGLYISLSGTQVEQLKELAPEQGDDIFLKIPQFRVLISGLDQNGEVVSTVRTIPATATYSETLVEEQWIWVNTSVLKEVWGLQISVSSPIEGIESILLDNLTLSDDFEPAQDYFTIALIPDTQKYTEFPELEEIFGIQTAYLVDQMDEENIVFTSHLGDIVEHGNNEHEWIVADAAMQILDGVMPYGIVIGNHDFQDEWENPQQGSPLFRKYFPGSRFSGNAWWGGYSPDGLSSYQLFETGHGTFLYLHVTVDSPPPTVEWAQSVLENHPGIPSLLTTHVYLRENGRIPVPYLSGMATGDWQGISANELFDSLVSTNNQVFMVTCGHISAEHHQVSKNKFGNNVYELLQDYQNRESGGEGFLRLLRFYPDKNLVQVITYSPWLLTYEMDEDSYFRLNLDFNSLFSRPS